jgi:hypothetical protein
VSRSTEAQKVERLNAAHALLARGVSVADAAVVLSRRFALSQRQAYRYLEEAAGLSRPAPVVEPTVAVTFKLAPSLIGLIRARAVTDGTTISALVSRALRAFLGHAGGRG